MRCLSFRLPWIALMLLALNNLLTVGNTAEPIDWKQDLSAGNELAETTSRDLFLLFTGRTWCGPCIALETNVLSQDRFRDAVQGSFVMVEFDFPADDSDRASEVLTRLQAMQKEYGISYFPTMVLADSTGRPYACLSQYDSSTGPDPLIRQIQSAQKAREARDNHFHEASKSHGAERIIQLHRGLEAIAPLMGNPDEQETDALLKWYQAEIDEIVSFQGDLPAGIVGTYRQRIDAQAASMPVKEIEAKLQAFEASKEFRGAVAYLDERMKTIDDLELRQRLAWSRVAFLERDKQYQRALAESRRLLRDGNLDSAQREQLLDREAYNLFSLNRMDEALAHYDRRIAAAAENSPQRLRLMGRKAQHALSRLEPEHSIPIWEAYRHAMGNESADWFDTTVLLARQYQKTDQHTQAITLFEEALVKQDDAWVLIDLIRSFQATGHDDQAKQLLAKVRAEQARLVASPRAADRDEAEDLETRLRTIHLPVK